MTEPDERLRVLLASAALVPDEIRADWEEYVTRIVADVWERPVLDERQRSIITVAGIAALRSPAQLRIEARHARLNGLSRLELCEIVMQVAGYLGLAVATEAMIVLREVFDAEGDAAGEEVPTGHVFPPVTGRQDRAREVLSHLQPHQVDLIMSHSPEYPMTGGKDRPAVRPDLGWLGWIGDTAFGDFWSRPRLTDEERERVTTAGLIVLGRRYELRGHFQANFSFGFTPEEVAEGILQLGPYIGFPSVVDVMLLAREVQQEMLEGEAPAGDPAH
jgi:4-carboxymuconolactone decarboxylase